MPGSCGIPEAFYLACSQTNQHWRNPVAKKRKKQIARKRKKQNLTGLDFEGLMNLRNQIDEALTGYRSTLERQLAALGSSVASLGGKVARGMRGSMLKGRKVAPKYRSPEGDTWAGRGATPRWLKAAIKEGKKLEDFAIEKTVGKAKKSRKKK
jgi:DNA-binding protein H-NS